MDNLVNIRNSIPEGKIVIHRLSYGYLDGSLHGCDTMLQLEGLRWESGRAVPFTLDAQDTSLTQVLRDYPQATYYAHGIAHLFDECRLLEVRVAPIMISEVNALFPELQSISLPIESYLSRQYDLMRVDHNIGEWYVDFKN